MRNRRVFSTMANASSSRSHLLLTIKLVIIPTFEQIEFFQHGKCSHLTIVDLAGSERHKKTFAKGLVIADCVICGEFEFS